MIIELLEKEEKLFQEMVDWLSVQLSTSPTFLKQQTLNFQLNPSTRTFINENGKLIELTSKEFDLLYFLYSHRGQVFSKEQLYENVWGYDNISDGSNLTSFIRKLRKKIEPDPDNPQYILTVWGVGYKFNEKNRSCTSQIL